MARTLRSADSLLAPAVAETIAALKLAAEDAGAVKLAKQYAAAIDSAYGNPLLLEKLGPKLLAALESLGATPRARAALRKEMPGAQGRGKLAAIRDARRPA